MRVSHRDADAACPGPGARASDGRGGQKDTGLGNRVTAHGTCWCWGRRELTPWASFWEGVPGPPGLSLPTPTPPPPHEAASSWPSLLLSLPAPSARLWPSLQNYRTPVHFLPPLRLTDRPIPSASTQIIPTASQLAIPLKVQSSHSPSPPTPRPSRVLLGGPHPPLHQLLSHLLMALRNMQERPPP